MLVPAIKVDIDKKVPSGNLAVMLLAAVTFAVQFRFDSHAWYLNGLVLRHWSVLPVFGYMWLHMNAPHVIGNLVTLWVFGRKVSTMIGNALYVLMYVLAGIGSAIAHVLYDGRPVIGSSGAIMGVFGIYVVVCFTQFGRIGPWLTLLWFLATLWAGVVGGFPDAYMSHIGGFLSGLAIGVFLVGFGVVDCRHVDPGLVRLLRVESSAAAAGRA